MHGGGGDEDTWANMGCTPYILDNLIAHEKVEPMIVVMTNGKYNKVASQHIVTPPPSDWSQPGPSGIRRNILKFPESLAKDVIPFVDKTFRTKSDRENSAIAGLSICGAQTLYTAF
ncbi:MAG: hypothetical protein JXB19_09570 [Bacteroidales bacterium]|nr:hypothetical protein [Bacteroidales bacterium]